MKIGIVGLGCMGSNVVRRLLRAGHECVAFDVHPQAARDLSKAGARVSGSLAELVSELQAPRAIWIMVPAAVVDSTLGELASLLAKGDTLIDDGNSYYHDDIRRAETLGKSGIHYVDVGTSGGVWGFDGGYCLMIGGTAPLRHPEYYQYDLNVADIAETWRHGCVIGSWLLDLTTAALKESLDLKGFVGRVSDSGEGRWTLKAAIDEGVPAPVLSTALTQRFASRGEEDFANQLLSAMRYEFGGHEEKHT